MQNTNTRSGQSFRPIRFIKGPLQFLLFGLIAIILAFAIFEEGYGFYILVALIGVVVAAIHYTTESNRPTVIALVLGGLFLLLVFFRILDTTDLIAGDPFGPTIYLAGCVFFLYATVRLLLLVVRATRVDGDTLYGSAAVYFLIGLSFAFIYSFIDSVHPGAFSGEGHNHLYFSYVTLTTLGYGDIAPAIPLTRSLAILEASTGVLYTAMLIARLMGLYTGEQTQEAVEAALENRGQIKG